MASVRQEKIASLLQQELSFIFQKETRDICLGSMVSVTNVKVSSDLSVARVYLSIFAANDKEEVLKNIQVNAKQIKHALSQIVKMQLRKTPNLTFFIDDSLDYAEEINELLKK
jgi:ribosome-binding factor A